MINFKIIYYYLLTFLKIEIWKPIPDYPGYEVSNLGKVKSFYGIKPKLLKTKICRFNYHSVRLQKNKKQIRIAVHKLVMLVFIGPSELQIDHLSRNKSDNTLLNLEYVTSSENQKRWRKLERLKNE